MLEIRPNCECCDVYLPPSSNEAVICTFCRCCAEGVLKHICPNCGGNLVQRPVRPVEALKKHPASNRRIVKESGCLEMSALMSRNQ